jgi:hypothetical protein
MGKYSQAAIRKIARGQRESWTPARRALAGQRLRRAAELVGAERFALREKVKETREDSNGA